MTVVVAGATGGIGEGAVRALLESGRVIAVGRNTRRLEELRERLGAPDNLDLVEADVGSPDSDAVAARIQSAAGGMVDGALISIGVTPPPSRGTVLDIPEEQIRAAIADNEIAGLRALRALVPCVRPEGAVISLMGYSAEIPFPGNPLMGSTNAALRSLVTTLAVQLPAPRVYGMVIGVVRTRARQAAGIDHPGWLSGDEIGRYAGDLVRGDVEHPEQTLRYLLDPVTGPALTPPNPSHR